MTINTYAKCDHRRVVIVGGGIAGLSAAWALASVAPNLRITLLESRRNCGGRAGSFADPTTDETVDYCQHVAMGCCTNLMDLLADTGLLELFTRHSELTFYYPGSEMSAFRPNLWMPAPLHLHRALSGLKYLSGSERNQIRRGIFRLMRQTESELAATTAADWLDRFGQDEPARTKFWDVVLVSALGDTPENVSMGAARKVIVDGFAGAHHASDVWVPNRPLSEIFGAAMSTALSEVGVEVRTGVNVQLLKPASDLRSVDVVCGDDETISADHVILATAWRSAERLIASIKFDSDSPEPLWQTSTLKFLNTIRSSPITGIHLWFDRALTQLPHVAMVGTTAHWLFCQPLNMARSPRDRGTRFEPRSDSTTNDPTTEQTGIYHQVVISGRHHLSDAPKEVLLQTICDELKAAFPEAFAGERPAGLLHHRIVTDPNAVYSVTPDFQAHRPTSATPVPWLSLAGDYVQTGWPATMEGATISGRLAATNCLQHLAGDSIPDRDVADANLRPMTTPPLPRGRLARWCVRGS